MSYPEYIMKDLRQRRGLEPDDTSKDQFLQTLKKNTVLREVLRWNNLVGAWDENIKAWVKDIYGVDLDEIK